MNYKLKILYDGSHYSGWQIQNNAVTIQQKIVDAIKTVLKESVNLIGSGRTDSGVHALGQIANFQYSKEIDLFKFQYSLNSILPNDISVNEIKSVEENFHSRFDAQKRSYIYLITKSKSPFFFNYSYLNRNKLDIDLLNKVSKTLLGKYDFTSFSKKNTDTKNNICEIYNTHWKIVGNKIIFLIEGNRFLHGMVRAVIGSLLKSIKENDSVEYIKKILIAKDRCKADEAVPAKGLFLYKVKY